MSQGDARDEVACFVVPALVFCLLSMLLGVVIGRMGAL